MPATTIDMEDLVWAGLEEETHLLQTWTRPQLRANNGRQRRGVRS